MPARQRHSAASSSTTRPAARRAGLPEYEPLQFPLTAKGQNDLASLSGKHSLRALDKLLQDAMSILQENAAEINDMLHSSTEFVQLREADLNRISSPSEERRAHVEKLSSDHDLTRIKVQDLTKRIEENVRKTIDCQQSAEDMKQALASLIRDHSSSDGSTQTQQRTQQRTQDTDYPMPGSFVPTEPGNTQAAPTSPITSFRTQLTRKRDAYTSYDHRQRYATNNDYRQFRKLLHDAQHQDADVPMPHESTWFGTQGNAAPGMTQAVPGTQGGADEGDSDEDLAIARETISTRCPITLRDFDDPVTSRKCPHSFEKEAIAGMIRASAISITAPAGVTVGRSGQVKAVRCPVPGCDMVLAEHDLYHDAVLRRKIARMLSAKRRLEDDEYAEEENRPGRKRIAAVDIGSSQIDIGSDDEGVAATGRKRVVKGEKRQSSVEL